MDKIKKHSKKGFTTVSNTVINDEKLSFKAKGVFVYLWSKPDDWVVRITDLCNRGTEGKTAIYTALQELEDNGYLTRARYYENGKIAGINYDLYDEKLNSENLNEENLNEENQPYSNKELIPNTDLLQNTDEYKGNYYFSAEVIDHLNLKAKTKYRHGIKKTVALIDARRKEGFTIDDFKAVIDKKVAQWGNDAKMSVYLRPETLFGTKFEGYLNEQVAGINMLNVNGKDFDDGKDEWRGAFN